MSIQVSLSGNIIVTDSITGNQQLQKSLTGLSMTGTVQEYAQSFTLASGANAITLPVSPAQFLYIKNLHASNTVIITWTPNGGSSATIFTLEPSGFVIFGNGTTGAGITALSLNASASNTPVEIILAG